MCTKVTFEKVLPAITVSPVMLAWFDAPHLPLPAKTPKQIWKENMEAYLEQKKAFEKKYYGSRYSKASTCRVCGHSGR